MFVPLFAGKWLKNKVLFSKSALATDHKAAKERRCIRQPGLSDGMWRVIMGFCPGSR
ncbi:hypothetical protein GCM10009754_88460 [Amycolatopsis minnesotensis]|uniref:Uncharacterized protein n=1 Tax=Amycolatopsis minnesotensis TaxID=337894 RepID=A0ABN2T1V1_9PSEU